jgi:hypothetical protein
MNCFKQKVVDKIKSYILYPNTSTIQEVKQNSIYDVYTQMHQSCYAMQTYPKLFEVATV